MNQHSIQEAYLKLFCVNGKLWAHDINTKTALNKPASWCTSEVDFQPEFLDRIQNDMFESPGIKSLKKLLDGNTISLDEFDIVRYWSALHIIRSQKYRNNPNVNYEIDYHKMIEKEMLFSHYFKHSYICESTDGKYFITSDNPIIEIPSNDSIIRVFTISPTKLLLLTPIDEKIRSTEIEFTELVNTSLWANAYKYVFSDKKVLPLSTYDENIKKWNIVVKYEQSEYIIKNKN